MKTLSTLFAAFLLVSCSNNYDKLQVVSPDSKNSISFSVSEDGKLTYQVSRENQVLLSPSPMGFEFKDGRSLCNDFSVIEVSHDSKNEKWKTVWGQNEEVLNHYNELTVKLRQESSGIRINLSARAFNDGVAFRYEFPEQAALDSFVISNELTGFNFASDYSAWWGYADYDNYEKKYYNSHISEIGDVNKYARRVGKEERKFMSNTPMTVEINDSIVMCVHEAELTDYPDMSLERLGDTHSMKAQLTPWMNADLVRAKAP